MRYDSARLTGFSDTAVKERKAGFDTPFFLLVLLLLTMGVVMVLSASFPRAYYDPGNITGGNAAYYFVRQLLFALLGTGVMLLASKLPMGFYRRYSFPFLAVALVLLMLVPFVGVKVNGSRRWLGVGGLTLQPSELAKLAVILSFSVLIGKMRGRMRTFRYGILPFGAILCAIVGLLVLEPHFSASIIIIVIGGVMMFLGGVGLGGSRQKFLYLPEEHNDFIFSVACEELGFIGAALILALFALLILRGYWIALHQRDRFNFLTCAGISTLLAIQVFLNVAVVTNLVPCTGISLPLFSYGGTALLIQLFEMGIILSASRELI